jgi:hypothetical protein
MYFDHANNYWVAAVSLGYKAGKRVRRKVTGRTKTEVKIKLRELRRDLDSGVRSSTTYTVGAALDEWLASGLSGKSDRTKELYQDTVKPLREPLGDVKLKEPTAGDVQETLEALAAAKVVAEVIEGWLRLPARGGAGRSSAGTSRPPRAGTAAQGRRQGRA